MTPTEIFTWNAKGAVDYGLVDQVMDIAALKLP